MRTVFALLCFVVVIHWLIFPYPSGLLHWHCGNLTIAPVLAKQPWWIWIKIWRKPGGGFNMRMMCYWHSQAYHKSIVIKSSRRFEIWQAPRQHSRRGSCQISERQINTSFAASKLRAEIFRSYHLYDLNSYISNTAYLLKNRSILPTWCAP